MSIFEELMRSNRQITNESVKRGSRKVESSRRKIKSSLVKIESMRKVTESEDFDELDKEFDADVDNDEVVLVIDPEAPADEEVPSDAAKQMVGDLVYKCPVCGGNYVCNCDPEKNEALELDDDGVPVECPICGDDTEQILIGEIAPVEDAGEQVEMDPVDVEDSEPEDEDNEEEVDSVESEETTDVEEEESLKNESKGRKKEGCRRKRSKEDVNIGGNGGGNKSSSKDSSSNPLDDFGPVDEFLDIASPDIGLNVGGGSASIPLMGESLEGEDDEFCADCEPSTLVPTETYEAPDVKIDAQVVNLTLDDKKFESLMTNIIRENYNNCGKFNITRVACKGSKLKVEYVVRGKKNYRGIMVGEGFNRNSRRIRMSFKDKGAFTESFSNSPSFIVEFVRVRNSFVPTSVSYDYKVRVNESVYRVYGKSVSGR